MATIRQRKQNLLGDKAIAAKKEPGRYSDGNGLYLVVRPGGSKQWMFLYRRDGKLREMGWAQPLKSVTLAKAHNMRDEAQKLLRGGPIRLKPAGSLSRRPRPFRRWLLCARAGRPHREGLFQPQASPTVAQHAPILLRPDLGQADW